jgi:hypothetical protein
MDKQEGYVERFTKNWEIPGMTSLQFFKKLKEVLLYEIAPRKLRERWSKRGPNMFGRIRPRQRHDHRLSGQDHPSRFDSLTDKHWLDNRWL